jgi:hypothetical protein
MNKFVTQRDINQIKPAPENEAVYAAIAWDDPAIKELSKDVKEHGLIEPILISTDGFINSGHRRRVAAALAGLTQVPVKVHPISRAEDPQGFMRLLVAMNSQRIKSTSDLLHETIVKIDPKDAHKQIVNQRLQKDASSGLGLSAITPSDLGRRDQISEAKQPLLDAVLEILNAQREYWPLSVRQVHYRLLGSNAPLIHASKPDSQYRNDKASYRSAIDILARGRVAGLIPWGAIDDLTRPVDLNKAFTNTSHFLRQGFKNFLKGYWRDRLQSQPYPIEIVAEKLTVQTILAEVAREFTMPLSISRGMNTLAPKKSICDRYLRSQKQGLKLLVVTDLDPAGETIAEDLVKSFRRDFGLQKIEVFKVALTIDQVEYFELQPSMDAKKSSPTYKAFVTKYGSRLRAFLGLSERDPVPAFELEAFDPGDLANELRKAIIDVLDIDLYNQELEAEEKDSAQIIAVQQQTAEFFKSFKL